MPEAMAPVPNRPYSRAVRLTFAYEGDRVSLVDQQRVEMIVPPPDAVRDGERVAGFWLELKDAQNRTLFRRILHQPIRQDAEVFSPGNDRNITRKPVAAPKGYFVALVPDTDQGLQVALAIAAPPPADAHPTAKKTTVKEIARFQLNK